MPNYEYDMLVIGSGPAGHHAAIQAAKLGKKVAVAERKGVVGGVCINLGTIPSKTLREAVLYLSGSVSAIFTASLILSNKTSLRMTCFFALNM